MSFSNTEIAFRAKSDLSLRRAQWLFKAIERPWLVRVGTSLAETALKWRLPVQGILEQTFFRQFCGGETIEGCEPVIRELDRFGIGTILDYSVEALANEPSLPATAAEILRTVEKAAKDDAIPFCVFKMTALARTGLMAKKQAVGTLSAEEDAEWRRAQARVDSICDRAAALGVRVFVDAEDSWYQDVVDGEATRLMARHNRERALVYNTIQMYRKDRTAFLEQATAAARVEGYYLGVKLVRGAYLEKERARARDRGRPSPIHDTKADTDRAYDDGLRFCVDNRDRIALCAGTHNERSNELLAELMEKAGVAKDDERFYFSQLYGMGDHISYNLADAGFHVAKYVPYGPLRSVFPYLARRAEENTSIQGQTGRELGLINQEISRRHGRA